MWNTLTFCGISSHCCIFQLQENVFIEEEGMDVVDVVSGALEQCDLVCLMYDSSDASSFSVAASMMVRSCILTLCLAHSMSLLVCRTPSTL